MIYQYITENIFALMEVRCKKPPPAGILSPKLNPIKPLKTLARNGIFIQYKINGFI